MPVNNLSRLLNTNRKVWSTSSSLPHFICASEHAWDGATQELEEMHDGWFPIISHTIYEMIVNFSISGSSHHSRFSASMHNQPVVSFFPQNSFFRLPFLFQLWQNSRQRTDHDAAWLGLLAYQVFDRLLQAMIGNLNYRAATRVG